MSCELWCDRALPPDGVPGWGFLVNETGYVSERYKLSAEAMRKRGMILAWCSYECREACIARQRLVNAPEPAAPVRADEDGEIAWLIGMSQDVDRLAGFCGRGELSEGNAAAEVEHIAKLAYAAGRKAAFDRCEAVIRAQRPHDSIAELADAIAACAAKEQGK
jgi:hypothetical protein